MAFRKSKHDGADNSTSLADEYFGGGPGAGSAGGVGAGGTGGTNAGGTIGGIGAGGGAASVPGADQAARTPGQDESSANSLFSTETKQDFGPDYTRKRWFEIRSDNPELNPYAAEQDKRYGFDPRFTKTIRMIVLGVVCIVLATLLPSPSYNTAFSFGFSGLVTGLQENVAAFFDFLGGNTTPVGLINYKLCTYVIVFLAGIALAITGTVYQGSLKNALASPTTLGINAGGTLGVAIFALLAPVALIAPMTGGEEIGLFSMSQLIDYYNSLTLPEYIFATEGRALCSLVGCFIAVGLVLLVSHLVGRGTSSGFALIICGQVVAAVASSATECIRYFVTQTDTSGVRSTYISQMQNGSISQISTLLDLALIGIPIIIGTIIVIMCRRKLNLLAFKDEEARSMGISTERLRWVIVGVCTLITAVVISFCGNVAFIGFAIPLIARRYVGPDFNYLIPCSAFMGGAFMVIAYWFTDLNLLGLFGLTGSVNLITSTIGVILFVVVTLKQREANRNGDWL